MSNPKSITIPYTTYLLQGSTPATPPSGESRIFIDNNDNQIKIIRSDSTVSIVAESTLPATTKGDVLVHNGTQLIRFAVGSDGQVLVADSAEASGVKWGVPSTVPILIQDEGSSLTQRGTINFIGDLVSAVDNPGSSRTDITIDAGFTAKGDLLVRNSTNPGVLTVGSNDQILVADSTQTFGMRWTNAPLVAAVSFSGTLDSNGEFTIAVSNANTKDVLFDFQEETLFASSLIRFDETNTTNIKIKSTAASEDSGIKISGVYY